MSGSKRDGRRRAIRQPPPAAGGKPAKDEPQGDKPKPPADDDDEAGKVCCVKVLHDAILKDPDDPVFALVRADLARLYLAHTVELVIEWMSDDEVVRRVNEITGALIGLSSHARRS